MSHNVNRVNQAFVFPATDGAYNQVIRTDGNGQLYWTAPKDNSINVVTLADTSPIPLAYSINHSEVYYVQNPTGTRTITLPDINDSSFPVPKGYKVNVKNLNGAGNTIVIQPNSTNNNEIDGSTSITHSLSTQYENITFVCDGSNTWYRV